MKWDALYKRDNFQCRHCKGRNGITPHHIVFRSHQGEDDLSNMLTLCWQCHRALHDAKLEITLLWVDADNYPTVSFTRRDGWRPR